jgi:transposase
MLFSSKEEREKYIIELYKRGKTIREIAREVHMAFGPICAVIKKFNGENENSKEEKSNTPSKDTQAFRLFLEGKKPVEVVVELDVAADQVSKLYQQFLGLESSLYQQLKRGLLPLFLKLFDILKEQEMLK